MAGPNVSFIQIFHCSNLYKAHTTEKEYPYRNYYKTHSTADIRPVPNVSCLYVLYLFIDETP